jgi:hypothetical protein
MTKTENETMMTIWKNCIFSENIYAWFESDLQPVFSDKMEDLMLPEDRVIQPNRFANGDLNQNVYEVFTYRDSVGEYLYTGRLYTPKNSAKLV